MREVNGEKSDHGDPRGLIATRRCMVTLTHMFNSTSMSICVNRGKNQFSVKAMVIHMELDSFALYACLNGWLDY